MKKIAIIVAGGSGNRFGSTIPKQFAMLSGKPMLMHTIAAFSGYDSQMQIIVALPSEYISLWEDLCHEHGFAKKHTVVEGGKSRFESVKKSLAAVADSAGLIAVHDGARPLVSQKMIADGFSTAENCGTAIPTIAMTDSLRQLDRQGSHIVDRESFVAVQTPQIFNLQLLRKAYDADFSPAFTDDASVVEFHGTSVTLYEGDIENLKVTHPIDLKIAELILSQRNAGNQ